jgi:hypothetical protein
MHVSTRYDVRSGMAFAYRFERGFFSPKAMYSFSLVRRESFVLHCSAKTSGVIIT